MAQATLGAPGYDRDAGGKLTQSVAKIPVERSAPIGFTADS